MSDLNLPLYSFYPNQFLRIESRMIFILFLYIPFIFRPNKIVWHGANNDPNGTANLNYNCDDWKSESHNYKGLASSLHKNRLLDPEV